MTIDEFFAHVEANGFNGYSPAKSDVMGDAWARKVGQLWDIVSEPMPRDEFKHKVYLVFQWLYCELAGMRGRVVASPPAMSAAGMPATPDVVSKACELLLASCEV